MFQNFHSCFQGPRTRRGSSCWHVQCHPGMANQFLHPASNGCLRRAWALQTGLRPCHGPCNLVLGVRSTHPSVSAGHAPCILRSNRHPYGRRAHLGMAGRQRRLQGDSARRHGRSDDPSLRRSPGGRPRIWDSILECCSQSVASRDQWIFVVFPACRRARTAQSELL